MNRQQLMQTFLDSHLKAYRIEALPGDASFRRYYRIYSDHDKTYLLMDAPPDKESVVEFVKIACMMGQVVNTPDIVAQDIEQGFLLLQDFGELQFAQAIGEQKQPLYHQALTTLIAIQNLPTQDLVMYSDEWLLAEMALFTDWFLPYVGVQIDPMLWENFCQVVLEGINSQPKVVVHRDYHSRNLMIDKHSDRLGVIDFQDACVGAYTYDLVSLLRDAYIDIDDDWVMTQIQAFHSLKKPSVDLSTFIHQTNIMGVQRHLKVLGIFVRLAQRDGKARYLADIPKVMHDLCYEVNALVGVDPVFLAFDDWLQDVLYPAYMTMFV